MSSKTGKSEKSEPLNMSVEVSLRNEDKFGDAKWFKEKNVS